jgi:serine/threonine protein kinase/tetratricopeptide (TPR) repeat protein
MSDVREELDLTTFADPLAALRVALRDHYEIERRIGQGAFATVYLARDLKHERRVAIKVLNADPTSETGELRFIREIRLLARLQHPNILPLHDSGHVQALLYYVMPYVSGDTLRDRMSREKQLSPDAACAIAKEVGDALAYAHAQGIIHRDIKPENILLSAGHPILADFGIAHVINVAGVRQLTQTGPAGPGTPAYMSPEQLTGDREVDGRSDTYSLGCVLYEMLTGKAPFAGKDGFVKRFTELAPRVSQIRRDLPSWIDSAVAKSLERNPTDRYPTATEFVAALCSPDVQARDAASSSKYRSAITSRGSTNLASADSRTQRSRFGTFGPLERWVRHQGISPRIPRPTPLKGIALLSVLVVAAFGVGKWRAETAGQNSVATHPAGTAVVAVAPFRIDSPDPSFGFLREGMVDLLGATLGAGTVNWRTVDPAAFLTEWRRRAGTPGNEVPLNDAIAIAREAGASHLVRGAIVRGRGGIIITATLVTIENGHPVGRVEVSGSVDSVSSLVDQLATQLLGLEAGENETSLGILRGTPLPAVRDYLAGREAFRRADYSAAVQLQNRALAVDSTFAVAAVELGRMANWIGDDVSRRRSYELAWAHKERLGAFDLALLRAMLGPRYPEGSTRAEMLASWERVAELQPGQPDGWYESADLLFHNPWLGTGNDPEGLARARALFLRALDRAPNYWPAFQHLLQLAAHDRDSAELTRLWTHASTANLSSDVKAFLSWRVATFLSDSSQQRIAWAGLDRASLLPLQWVAMTSQEDGIAMADAARAIDLRLARSATDGERVDALLARHALALNSGDWKKAQSTTSALRTTTGGSGVGRELQVLDVAYGGVPADKNETEAVRELQNLTKLSLEPTEANHEQRAIDRCLVGHRYLSNRDLGRTEQIVGELHETYVRYPKQLWSAQIRACELLLDAWLAVLGHRPDVARRLDVVNSELSGGVYMTSRLLWDITVLSSAHLFESAGQLPRAYTSIRRRNWFYRWPTYLAPQLFATGRLALLVGDTTAAVLAYRHYLAIRTSPDSLFLPEVSRARQTLSTIMSKQ